MNIVLDSNIYLHYRSFEDIPWQEELGCDEVVIVLSATVLEEIDLKKDGEKGKIKKRAKNVSSRIAELLLKEEMGKFPVVFLENAFATEVEQQQYHLDRNDNRILFDVIKSDMSTDDVVVVSADNTMLIRAKKMGFKIHKLDDKYLLNEELTKEEKELKAIRTELDRLKNRSPKPSLLFDNGSDHIQIQRLVSSEIETLVRNEMDALKAQWPEKTIEDGRFIIMGQIYNALTPEKVIAYNNTREEFLKLSEKKIRLEVQRNELERRMVRVLVVVYNAGTAPTGKMNIFLQVPENIKLYDKSSKKSVSYTEPKTPDTDPLISRMTIGGIYVPAVKLWDLNSYYKNTELSKISESLTHNLKCDVFELYVDSATCPNFQMRWYIADEKIVEIVSGTLNVSFVE